MPNDVKWIRITTDMFNDEKIKIIENMPDADSLIVIWVKMICQAGKVNDDGWIYLDKEIPYTIDELSMILERPVNTVRLALETFKRLKMIEWDENGIYLINFTKNQNTIGLEKIREDTRKRVAAFRERQKLIDSPENVTLRNVTVTHQKRKEKNNNREEQSSSIPHTTLKNNKKDMIDTSDPDKFIKGKYGHVVKR